MNQSSFGHTKLRRYFRISWFEMSGALFSSFLAADLVDRIRDPYTAFLQRLLIKKLFFIINSMFVVNFNLKFRFKRHKLKMYWHMYHLHVIITAQIVEFFILINIIFCILSFQNILHVTNAKFDKWNVTKKNSVGFFKHFSFKAPLPYVKYSCDEIQEVHFFHQHSSKSKIHIHLTQTNTC